MFYCVLIYLSYSCYYLVGSSWLLELLDRWWDQLGRVDGGVSLEELMMSSWKGVELLESSLQTAQMVDVEGFSDGNIKESSPDS